jgi:hypothetical protein
MSAKAVDARSWTPVPCMLIPYPQTVRHAPFDTREMQVETCVLCQTKLQVASNEQLSMPPNYFPRISPVSADFLPRIYHGAFDFAQVLIHLMLLERVLHGVIDDSFRPNLF